MLDEKVNTLLTITETGSFTQAAEKLNLTQPAVSHHVRMLEKQYGITVFKRVGKGIRLTDEGEILVRYARRLSAMEEEAREKLEHSRTNVTQLHVGITQTAGENRMPLVFARYCETHPEIRFHLQTDTISEIFRKMSLYELDLAVVEGILPHDHFPSILLDTDELCLMASGAHPFAGRESVTLEELKKERLILRTRAAGTRMYFEHVLWTQNESIRNFNVVMELDSIPMLKELIAENMGVTVLARSVCREEIRTGRLAAVALENTAMVRETHIVYQPDFAHSDIPEEFRRLYQTVNY